MKTKLFLSLVASMVKKFIKIKRILNFAPTSLIIKTKKVSWHPKNTLSGSFS